MAGRPPGSALPLIMVGGVHGDEPASVEAVLELLHSWAGTGGGQEPALGGARPEPRRPGGGTQELRPRRRSQPQLPRPELQPSPIGRAITRARRPPRSPRPGRWWSWCRPAAPWGVVAVHAPFACINYDGPAAAWAEAVAKRERLAGAGRHRLSHAGLAGQLAGRGPRAAGADGGVASRAPSSLSGSPRCGPWPLPWRGGRSARPAA